MNLEELTRKERDEKRKLVYVWVQRMLFIVAFLFVLYIAMRCEPML